MTRATAWSLARDEDFDIRPRGRRRKPGMQGFSVLAVAGLSSLLVLGACGSNSSDSASDTTGTTTVTSTAAPPTTESPVATSTTATSTTVTSRPTPTTTAAVSTTTTAKPTAAPATTRPAETAVTVKQFQFMPPQLVVKAGTKVTWTNQDQILHTATSGGTPGTPDGKFDGPMDGVGKSFSFTFDQPGNYPYYCSRHTSMTGTVTVQ